MASKPVSVDFFRLDSEDSAKTAVSLERILNQQKKDVDNGARFNIKLFDFFVRFASLTKEDTVWIGHLEKVRTEEYAIVGNLAGARDTYATNQDEGPVSDTTFFFWPSTRVVGIYRVREGLSHRTFESYLNKLLNEVVNLSIILTEDKARRLSNMRLVKKLVYKISRPTNATFLKSEKTGFFREARMIDELNSDSMDVIIAAGKGKKLEKDEVVKKADGIMKYNNQGVIVDKMKIVGREHQQAVEETIDLIEDRMVYREKLSIPKDKKITPVMMIDVTRRAYLNKKAEIARMYVDKE